MKILVHKIRYHPDYKKINHIINLTICLGCLGLVQVLKGTIVAAFSGLLPLFFCVQFFGSFIQGSVSDIYKRSTVLNISLLILILTVLSLIFSAENKSYYANILQVLCIIAIGLGGNADTISRAEMIDISFHSDRRKIMSWTVFAEAFSWVIIGYLIRYFNFQPLEILPICIVLCIILLTLSMLLNTDKVQDKKHLKNTQNELKLIIKNHFIKLLLITIIVILGEMAYFFFFYSQEDPIKLPNLLADSYLSWFIGMSLGSWILSIFRSPSDFVFLVLGLATSLISISIFLLGGGKDITDPQMFYTDSLSYSIAGLGSGIYLPCFYSMISRGYGIHFQGALTGWIDSLRVFGEAFSTAIMASLTILTSLGLIYLSCFLFLNTLILLIIFRKKVI